MTFAIIGGTYREVCVSPAWDQLYGSGLRAAAACTQLAQERGGKITLHTWAASSESCEVQCRADTYGIDLDLQLRANPIEFRYEHPLSRPIIYPAPELIDSINHRAVDSETALVFGLLEGTVPVSAKRLVYDPQAGTKAVPFGKTQLRASESCIIANLMEARSMLTSLGTDCSALKPSDIACGLLAKEKVAAVIVKNGVHGATVASATGHQTIPCYRTDQVFSIGSGDVFSGVFAYLWAVAGQRPDVAAEAASRATAYYCNSQSLPIPADIAAATHAFPSLPVANTQKRVYLAGPLFDMAERWFVEETKRCLESLDLTVFSPMHEVGYSKDPKYLASEDLKGMDECDLVFAAVDGLDAGTIFEIGYATAKGKPVVAYGEHVNEADLTMLVGTGTRFFRDYATALYQAAWTAASL